MGLPSAAVPALAAVGGTGLTRRMGPVPAALTNPHFLRHGTPEPSPTGAAAKRGHRVTFTAFFLLLKQSQPD